MAKAAKKESTNTSLVNIDEELAKKAAVISGKISAPGGDKIKITQDKQFVLPDGTKSPGPMSVVILDFISGNFFYDRPFKRGEESPPACFALSDKPKGMIPDASSPDVQAKTCDECPNNIFGSKGAGKACANTRLLAVVQPGSEDSPIYILQVSPTATKAFDAYVGTIKSQFNSTPIKVVTEIYFDPNLEYPSLRFGNPTPNKDLAAHFARMGQALERLMVAPDVSQYEAPSKKKVKK